MKLFFCVTLLFLNSCGIGVSLRNDKFMKSKGYDKTKDTVDIKPYEFFVYSKGYYPIHRQITPEHTLDTKISIKGFENNDSIPFDRIFEDFEIILNSSDSIDSGELHFSRRGATFIKYFGNKLSKECYCKMSFNNIKTRYRKLRTRDVLFFWNVTVVRNGIKYSIPARKYFLK